jgi:hypothetical protein
MIMKINLLYLSGLITGALVGLGFALVASAHLILTGSLTPIFFATPFLEIVLPLALVGFIFDLVKDMVPIEHLAARTVVIWAFLFPLFRVLRDLIASLEGSAISISPWLLPEPFAYCGDAGSIAIFVGLQVFFGLVFGIPFLGVYQKILIRLLKREAEKRRKPETTQTTATVTDEKHSEE